MLNNIIKKYYIPQRLHIKEDVGGFINSGISACIFGATGSIGKVVGATLGEIGSDVIYPARPGFYYNDRYKYLKLTNYLGMASMIPNINFEDTRQLRRLVSTSNVVINLIGPRKTCINRKDFDLANIEIPRRLARVARESGNVWRFVHFSACGADPKSDSIDFQTKYYGEQEVLNEFPEATIIRPTTIVSHYDYLTRIFLAQVEYFHNFVPVFSDLSAKREPISDVDISLAVLNILKLEQSKGKIYELGGNKVYSLLEIYEMLFNFTNMEPKLLKFNHTFWKNFSNYFINWEFFNKEDIIKQTLDIKVSGKYKTLDDLFIKPAQIEDVLKELVSDGKKFISEGKESSEF